MKVKKIADQIHLGAMVFMRREYTYLFYFVSILIILSYFALGANTAIAVTAGAISSALAGWLGMFSATNEPVWIALGIAIGAALGAGLNKANNTKED